MASFYISFNRMMDFEGWVLENVTGDRGGRTCCGISYVFNPNWYGWAILEKNGNILDEDVKNAVAAFYRIEYNKLKLDEIMRQQIADQVFQAYINCGGIALGWAQKIVGVTVDNVFGPVTVGAINSFNVFDFQKSYYESQVAYYQAIINKNPSQVKFIQGWLKRARAFA